MNCLSKLCLTNFCPLEKRKQDSREKIEESEHTTFDKESVIKEKSITGEDSTENEK